MIACVGTSTRSSFQIDASDHGALELMATLWDCVLDELLDVLAQAVCRGNQPASILGGFLEVSS